MGEAHHRVHALPLAMALALVACTRPAFVPLPSGHVLIAHQSEGGGMHPMNTAVWLHGDGQAVQVRDGWNEPPGRVGVFTGQVALDRLDAFWRRVQQRDLDDLDDEITIRYDAAHRTLSLMLGERRVSASTGPVRRLTDDGRAVHDAFASLISSVQWTPALVPELSVGDAVATPDGWRFDARFTVTGPLATRLRLPPRGQILALCALVDQSGQGIGPRHDLYVTAIGPAAESTPAVSPDSPVELRFRCSRGNAAVPDAPPVRVEVDVNLQLSVTRADGQQLELTLRQHVVRPLPTG